MKRILLIGLLIIGLNDLGVAQLWKQRRYEVYGGISTLNYFGDIGGFPNKSNLFGIKDISFRSTRPGFSFGGTYRLTELLYIRGQYTFGLLTQSDKDKPKTSTRSFTTIINECSIQGVFFIKPESDRNYYYSVMQLRGGLSKLNKPLSAYIYAGFGGNFYSVKPNSILESYYAYSPNHNSTLLIPLGIGVKFAFSPSISFGSEFGVRYLFTDFIDGTSPAPSKHNDIYYQVNIKAIYRFPKWTRLPKVGKRLKF